MVSVIITSYNEPGTIGRAINAFLKQKRYFSELIVVSPDKKTIDFAEEYKKKYPFIKIVKDKGEGKPEAVNLGIKKTNSEIIVLSDGDVYTAENSLKYLLNPLKNKEFGCVTGRPVSLNSRKNLFGFWAYILTENFHKIRKLKSAQNKEITASGYLYAVRKNLMPVIPKQALADDAYVSSYIAAHNKSIAYAESAKVFVNYPANLRDWISQKKRTAGRIYQQKSFSGKINELTDELIVSITSISEIKSLKEFFWFLALGVMRSYIWFRIFLDRRLWKRDFSKVWQRVESTKHINQLSDKKRYG